MQVHSPQRDGHNSFYQDNHSDKPKPDKERVAPHHRRKALSGGHMQRCYSAPTLSSPTLNRDYDENDLRPTDKHLKPPSTRQLDQSNDPLLEQRKTTLLCGSLLRSLGEVSFVPVVVSADGDSDGESISSDDLQMMAADVKSAGGAFGRYGDMLEENMTVVEVGVWAKD